MTKATIGVLSFVAGAAISAVATYFITRKLERAKSEIYIQQQLEEDRKALRDRDKDKSEKNEEKIKEDAVEEYCEKVRKERAEYRKIASQYDTRDKKPFVPFDPDDEVVLDALAKSHIEQDNPFIITEDEAGEDGFDIQYLYYHPDAGDVADGNGILVDPDETVGNSLFNKFVEDPDVDEIVVRNPFLMIDFWLTKEMLK